MKTFTTFMPEKSSDYMKKLLLLLLFCTLHFAFCIFYSTSCSAQNNPDIKRTTHWYFGDQAGLDFTSGSPVVDANYNDSINVQFTMSDTCGNLLLYGGPLKGIYGGTGNFLIFNKNHHLIKNGEIFPSLVGYPLCVPQPGNDSIYYLFYNYYGGGQFPRFYYSIINMKKNNGTGEIVSNNILLLTTFANWRAAATLHCNGSDIWIINKMTDNHQLDSIEPGKIIYAWLLDENGLNNTPVASSVVIKPIDSGGFLRFSPDGSKMAASFANPDAQLPDSCWIELYEFDNCTGVFFNPVIIDPFPMSVGNCFSPDNSKFYASSDWTIAYWHHGEEIFAQFDVSNFNQTDVLASEIIFSDTGTVSKSFQIGTDGKIYVFDENISDTDDWGQDKLGVINYPNLTGALCNYMPEQIDLLGGFHSDQVPPFVDSYFSSFDYQVCNIGVPEIIPDYIVDIFPNPASDFLNIHCKSSGISGIRIYNITGKICFEKKISDEYTVLDIHSFPSGLYFIQLDQNNNHSFINLKFIKL
ncbi:MAG: T9SS type A sorting domain-containing protein [Bacteroidota bacterium]